ncbi:hypothetical protein [Legionella erythra]|uniref:Transmembrane protein n=1 Tax=Legionella erythra TaxID=448 RepID=A0A0W0TQ40_LEGER|nr:hypothetical protein [Legionella erythra]KTC97747.1 hypothetical protein Lery_1586 [Legionella erythra]
MFDHLEDPVDKAMLCHALKKALPAEQSQKSLNPIQPTPSPPSVLPLIGFAVAGAIGAGLTALLGIGSLIFGLVTLKTDSSGNNPTPQSDPSLDKLEDLAMNGTPCQLVSQLNVKPETIGQSPQEDDDLSAEEEEKESLDFAQPQFEDLSDQENTPEAIYK